jgi:hypothetical protein
MKSVHWRGAIGLFGLAAAVALTSAQAPIAKATNGGPVKTSTPEPKKADPAPPLVKIEKVLLHQDAQGTATFRLSLDPSFQGKSTATIDVRSLLGETLIRARVTDPAAGSVEAALAKPVKAADVTALLTVLNDLKTKTITVTLPDGTTQTGALKEAKAATADDPALGQLTITVKSGDTTSDVKINLADIVSLSFRQDANSFDVFLRRAAANVSQLLVRIKDLSKLKLDVTVELGGPLWSARYEADTAKPDFGVFVRVENRTLLAWDTTPVLVTLGTPLDDVPFDAPSADARVVVLDNVSLAGGSFAELSANANKDLGVAAIQTFFVADGTKTGTLKYGVEIRDRKKWLGPGLVLVKEKGQLRVRQDGFKGALHLEDKPFTIDSTAAVSTLGSQWTLKEKSDVAWVGGLSDGALQIAYAYTTTLEIAPDASLPAPPMYFYRDTTGREIVSVVVRVREKTCTKLNGEKTTITEDDSDPQKVDITKWSAADLQSLLKSMESLDPDEGIPYGDATYILGQLLDVRRNFEAVEQQYKQALADNAKKQDRITLGNPGGSRRAATEQQRQRLEAIDLRFDRLRGEEADLSDQLAALVAQYDRYVRSLRIPNPIEIVSP